jgi:hypothetical protein
MMSEDEAKRKWCPFARAWDGQGASTNRIASGDLNIPGPRSDCNCIASKCMAWRWTRAVTEDGDPCCYCGLAGAQSSVG